MAAYLGTLARGLFASLVLMLVGPPLAVAAQEYDVELLVYANLRGDDAGERWPMPKTLPATERSINLGEAGTRALDSSPRELQAIAEAMRRSSQYRPLLHWRWRQPGWSGRQAQAIHLQIPAGADTPLTEVRGTASKQLMQRLKNDLELGASTTPDLPLLDGTATVLVTRYLHLAVDLLYIDPDTGVPLQLKESRRMRLNELHYLDHPRFGVLARISRAAP